MKIDKLIRSKRRTIGLQITSDAMPVVRVPWKAKMNEIEIVVDRHKDWIEKTKSEVIKKHKEIPVRHFADGEEFPYLGQGYKLRILDNQKWAFYFENAFCLDSRYQQQARQIFVKWYKLQAKIVIVKRARLFAEQRNQWPRRISITNANRRWGSCSNKGNLNFAWRLILAPIEAVDYVVAHELAHLEVKNHSKRFWDKVGSIYPDYEKWRAWLCDNERYLNL